MLVRKLTGKSFIIMEIPYRKSKNTTLYLAGCLLSIAGLFLIFNPPQTTHSLLSNPMYMGFIAGFLFLGAWKFVSTARKRSKGFGMRVTENGIEDFTSKMNKGQVLSWEKVAKLEIKEVVSSKFIVVYLHDPEAYIDSQEDDWLKKQLRSRLAEYGSPYCVSTASLQTNTKALFELFESYTTKSISN